MTVITIIGSGKHGQRHRQPGRPSTAHTVELMSRDTAKAQALAEQIGSGTTVGTYGGTPLGDIVIVAVLFAGAVDVVAHHGDALAGKILVDITNPFNADASGLVTTAGNSVTRQIAAVAPEGTHVVKAFNSILRDVPCSGHPGGRVLRRRRCRGKGTRRGLLGEPGHAAPRRRRARHGLGARMGRHPAGGGWRRTAPASTSPWGPKRSEPSPEADPPATPGEPARAWLRLRDMRFWVRARR